MQKLAIEAQGNWAVAKTLLSPSNQIKDIEASIN